jgi:hypothetical protein
MEETFAFRAEMTMLKRDDMKSTADLLLDLSHPVVDLIDPERIGALGTHLVGALRSNGVSPTHAARLRSTWTAPSGPRSEKPA